MVSVFGSGLRLASAFLREWDAGIAQRVLRLAKLKESTKSVRKTSGTGGQAIGRSKRHCLATIPTVRAWIESLIVTVVGRESKQSRVSGKSHSTDLSSELKRGLLCSEAETGAKQEESGVSHGSDL